MLIYHEHGYLVSNDDDVCGHTAARSIVTGVKAASSQSKYVLCLDDDVILHPSTLQSLVKKLENDPSAFMATGMPVLLAVYELMVYPSRNLRLHKCA